MDSSRILVALREQEKWRDRRVRLEARLKAVQGRRRFLQRELDVIRRQMSKLEDALMNVRPAEAPRDLHLGTVDRIR